MNKIIIYDFDGTLTPYPITTFKILEECGFVGGGNNKELQHIVLTKMKEKNIDLYNSFYETILEIVENNGYSLTNDVLALGADEIEYNNGILEYFTVLKNMNVDNYIVSSSMKCFLDNTLVSKYFKKIYASTFKYKNNNIIGLENLITDDKKIDAIREIVSNNNYNNVVYIGDGLTDLKAMKFIKDNGGISIFVGENIDDIKNRDDISFIFKRDYSKDSDLFKYIINFLK